MTDPLDVTFEQLRLTAKADEWVLPVDERDGEALVAIIVGHSRQVEMRRLG